MIIHGINEVFTGFRFRQILLAFRQRINPYSRSLFRLKRGNPCKLLKAVTGVGFKACHTRLAARFLL